MNKQKTRVHAIGPNNETRPDCNEEKISDLTALLDTLMRDKIKWNEISTKNSFSPDILKDFAQKQWKHEIKKMQII